MRIGDDGIASQSWISFCLGGLRVRIGDVGLASGG